MKSQNHSLQGVSNGIHDKTFAFSLNSRGSSVIDPKDKTADTPDASKGELNPLSSGTHSRQTNRPFQKDRGDVLVKSLKRSGRLNKAKTAENKICKDCGFTYEMHTKEGLDKIGFTDHEYAWKTMGVCKEYKRIIK